MGPPSARSECVATRQRRLMALALAIPLLISVWMRVVSLDNITGVNGDEAWYGVQMQQLGSGRAEWVTPTGNLVNPLYAGAILALHRAFEPAFWILRAPSVLAGLLLVALSYLLLRPVTGRWSAAVASVGFAVLPVDVLYSRLGWEPSWSPLAGLLVVVALLRGSAGLLAVSLLFARIIHATNVFLVPLVLTVSAARAWRERDDPRRWSRLAVVGGASLAVVLASALGSAGGATPVQTALARLADPTALAYFPLLLGRLFSGVTSYQYLAGPLSSWSVVWHDIVCAGLVLPVMALGAWRLPRERRGEALAWLLGLGLSLGAFYLSAGPKAIAPGNERYGLWLVAPVVVAGAICARAALRSQRLRSWGLAGVALLGVAATADIHTHYFAVIRETGGGAHRTFRTAAVEPKQQAFEAIADALPRTGPVRVLAEDWWLYWPLRYLAGATPEISVERLPPGGADPAQLERLLRDGAVLVTFHGEATDAALRDARPPGARKRVVPDYAGRPLLGLWDAPRAESSGGR